MHHMQFLIVDKMSHDEIIGTNELDKNGTSRQLQIGEELISFYKVGK